MANVDKSQQRGNRMALIISLVLMIIIIIWAFIL
jgi:hypothetical protein